MHREIQIKQFPIVTTHWWPKTRNERFVWENKQYLYCFLPLVHNHVQVIWVHTHIRCVTCVCVCVCVTCVWRVCVCVCVWRVCVCVCVCDVCDVCVRALWLTLHSHGASASTLDGGRVWSVVLTRRHSYNNQSHTSLVLHELDLHEAIWLADASVGAWKVASAPRFRHALRQALTPTSQSARTHTSHTHTHTHTHVTHRMCVCTQITWTWLCTRGKKRYKYCSFSHTNRSFRVLGHQCVVTMGNCLIWISLCMFFFPLIETVTYTCHYMTDRLERFDLKTSKLDLLKKKRHLHLGCPWGKLIDTTF